MTIKVQELTTSQPANGVQTQQPAAYPEADDPYRYGYRIAEVTQPNGRVTYQYIPLTQADFLNPQIGDQMVQSDPHIKLVVSLLIRFDDHYRNDPTVGVFSDLKMLWGIPGLIEPPPDLAIVFGLRAKHKNRHSFNVVDEGVRPSLVLEVMSPHYPGDDTTKLKVYEQVGIPEYILINPHFERDGDLELLGYHLVRGKYQRIKPDAHGRLLSETTGVWFELDETGREIVLTDAATGERLLTVEEMEEERLIAEARAEAAAEQAAAERQRADAEAQRADAAEAELARLRAEIEKRNRTT